MRDYRGKRKDNGEWEYGSLVKLNKINCTECTIVMPENFSAVVIPETIGQHISLSDKNGRDIYEGDILDCGKFIGVVEYNKIIAAFVVRINDSTDTYYHWSLLNEGDVARKEQLQYTEVIGNIHDNPELLKK